MKRHLLKAGAWVKLVLLTLFAVLVVTFVFLNLGAVVEPRVHLVFARFDRPGLLAVLLLTSAVSLLGGWLAGAAVRAVRQLREARALSEAAGLERRIARIEHAASSPTGPAHTVH